MDDNKKRKNPPFFSIKHGLSVIGQVGFILCDAILAIADSYIRHHFIPSVKTSVTDGFFDALSGSNFGCEFPVLLPSRESVSGIDGNVSHHHELLIDACECASENQNPYQPKAREVGEKILSCQHQTPEDSQSGQTALTFLPFEGRRSEATLLCEASNNAPVGSWNQQRR